MRKLIIAAMAVAGLVAQAGYAASRFELQPEGGAYLALGFGGPTRSELPFHYGLRFGYQRAVTQLGQSQLRLQQPGLNLLPPGDAPTVHTASLLSVEVDRRGDGIASVAGIPFARHVVGLHEYGGGGSESSRGGFTTVDWGLLVVGLGGAGYLLSEVAKSNNSPDPPPPSSSNSGSSCPGLICTLLPTDTGVGASDVLTGYDWLDDAHGHMGDLLPR